MSKLTYRDRLRRAICEASGFKWDEDMLELDEYGEQADAVMAVPRSPDLPPSDFAKQVIHLVDRALEGKILPEEAQALRLMVESLANDRREPVSSEELSAFITVSWPWLKDGAPGDSLSQDLLQAAVITKLPHPVWKAIEQWLGSKS